MKISVLVCTHNRAEDLRVVLASLARQEGVDFPWELVVVDNNSSDQTRSVVESFSARYLFEPKQGKSNALNTGVMACRGTLIAMTDDDVEVDAGWLAAYRQALDRQPEASFYGGRVVTRWPYPPPAWIADNYDALGCYSRYEGGDAPYFLADHRHMFIGANMAVRRAVFEAGHRYDPAFQTSGDSRSTRSRHSGEDGVLQEELMAKGLKGAYVPEALVHHRERPFRMRRRYVRWYCRESGRSARRQDGLPATPHFLWDVPRYLWRQLAWHSVNFLRTRLVLASRVRLLGECRLAKTYGDILECRAMRRELRSHS